VFKCVNLDTIL